jgi:cardiolipin synthase
MWDCSECQQRSKRLPILLIVVLITASVATMMSMRRGVVHALSTGAARVEARAASGESIQLFVEPSAGLAPVLSLIHQAVHSIRLEVYLLTDRAVIAALEQAKRRGVDVRVLLEEHPEGAARYARRAYDDLQRAGVLVHWANEAAFTYTHAKVLEVDNRTAGIFTFNLSASGFSRNREFGVIDQSRADADALATIFAADWNQRQPHISDARLVISPDNSRRDLQALIDGARHTLDLYAEEVNDASIETHLAAAVRRHVRVRLITSQPSPGVDLLRRSGVQVALMRQPYVHAKAIVADGTRLFIGSENLSSTSLDRNREVGILLNDRSVSSIVERTFVADWAHVVLPSTRPTAAAHGFSVRVTVEPRSVSRGERLRIEAYTSPGARCTVRVTYPDGYVSHARALRYTRVAGHAGTVSWSWRVGSTVSGTATAAVTCAEDGHFATASTTFFIQSSRS